MRVSFALTALGFLMSKPPANLHTIREHLLAVENNPEQFSELLNNNIQTLLSQNQYYEATLLIHYFKNRGLLNQAAIDEATRLVADNSEYDMRKDFAEYYILSTLVFIINSMIIPSSAPPKDMPEEAHLLFIVLKSILGGLVVSAFLMYKRANILEQKNIEQKNATTSEQFLFAFIARFTEKFLSIFQNGAAMVEAEHVRFEFQVKAVNENSSDFHRLLSEQPAAATPYLENAFGDHLVNVRPDPNDRIKIQLLVKYRDSQQCRHILDQISSFNFHLNQTSPSAAVENKASVKGPGQR